MNAIIRPPKHTQTADSRWSNQVKSCSKGGGSRRGKALPGFVRITETPVGFTIAWRWRYDVRWRTGIIDTRDEADAIRDQIRDALARGEEPGPLPKRDARNQRRAATATVFTPAELADRRARLAAQLAPDAERCARCGLRKPCDPCINELTREIRSARRGEQT